MADLTARMAQRRVVAQVAGTMTAYLVGQSVPDLISGRLVC